MSRKRCNRQVRPVLPPKWLRLKLSRAQVRNLDTTHLQTFDDIAKGHGTLELLLQWASAVATWLHVARAREEGVPEMLQQAAVVKSLTDRYHKTGRVVFSGPEYQLARYGVAVMNLLAEATDLETAKIAADVAEATVQIKEKD